MKNPRLIVMDGAQWIEAEVSVGGVNYRTAMCPADWRWRSALPGDVWEPKPRSAGKQFPVLDSMGRSAVMECEKVIIMQHHIPDKAALVRTADGRQRTIKWSDLKRRWQPTTERPLPRRAASATREAALG